MLVQFNYSAVPSSDALEDFVRAELDKAIARFESRLTRVEVHLADMKSKRTGPDDKRCRLEARPKGRDPFLAEDTADDLYRAVSGAVGKLERMLMTRLDPHS
ncbi:MAG: HPF/RaiA family ribosome-associated protein [Phycisphaerales bacterium]|nr:HPF/RaiA family ribosome-associated protein [Phycisphaerales bacterium]